MYNGADDTTMRVFECHECGLHHAFSALADDFTAKCHRCGGTLLTRPPHSLDRSLALSITGLVLIAIAVTMPFMSLDIGGRVQPASLITGAASIEERGMWGLAALVVFTTMVAPILKLGGITYVLIGLRLPRPPRHLPFVFRCLETVQPWSMIEVYLLGVFVAYVKLAAFGSIEIGPACYALVALLLILTTIDSVLGPEIVWERMEEYGLVRTPIAPVESDLALCEICSLVAPMEAHASRCPRCGARRHFRKPDSLKRAWALVITAAVLYFPANALPVMTIVSFGNTETDTILSGVKALFLGGMWPLALLVFFASITVPVLKIGGLIFLLISTQVGSRWRLQDRTTLYRIVEAVGRWSMIDVFMLSILAGLVHLGSLATIQTGYGAASFAAVVVTTMFAAAAFDPRLMWDAAGENP
ncbi:MAG TPA: paraquat-inducible protein A [Nitrolancea sp.]|nr:paraquat-inducible protein A [Nitrolancea sp.]